MAETQFSNKIALSSDEIWRECLVNIKRNVSQMTYNTWFLPIKPINVNNSTIKVLLPSQFFWEWIDEQYKSLIQSTIKSVIGPDANLTYVIAEETEDEKIFTPIQLPKKIERTEQIKRPKFETFINSRYTFDNFINGEGNQLARAAAGAIGATP